MPKDIVVIGASAGGIEALRVLAGGLPADFPGSLFVVLPHLAGSTLDAGRHTRPFREASSSYP